MGVSERFHRRGHRPVPFLRPFDSAQGERNPHPGEGDPPVASTGTRHPPAAGWIHALAHAQAHLRHLRPDYSGMIRHGRTGSPRGWG